MPIAKQKLNKIITFTNEERELVAKVFDEVSAISSTSFKKIKQKLTDLEEVATSISKYPSIKGSSVLAGKTRTESSLVESLCTFNSDSTLLTLPTKTILGKAYLVAKFHTFVAFYKVASNLKLEKTYIDALNNATFNIMFTIMAEDVYLSLLKDQGLKNEVKEEIAYSLTDLWESRLDKNTFKFSSMLTIIWEARTKIAPAFGTMLGTVEFFSFSGYVGTKWAHFISEKLRIKEVLWALEEFLFGISYEEIAFIREKLKEENLQAISRDEAFKMLNKTSDFTSTDVRSFYASYSERRNNAEARKRLKVEGPIRILEDYCVRSFFENKEMWKDSVISSKGNNKF
ncbi:MAG: hypothetical protein ACTTKH_00405 [Treponema sp.]